MKKYLGKWVLFTVHLQKYDGQTGYGRVDRIELGTEGNVKGTEYVCISNQWFASSTVSILAITGPPEMEGAMAKAKAKAPGGGANEKEQPALTIVPPGGVAPEEEGDPKTKTKDKVTPGLSTPAGVA